VFLHRPYTQIVNQTAFIVTGLQFIPIKQNLLTLTDEELRNNDDVK